MSYSQRSKGQNNDVFADDCTFIGEVLKQPRYYWLNLLFPLKLIDKLIHGLKDDVHGISNKKTSLRFKAKT